MDARSEKRILMFAQIRCITKTLLTLLCLSVAAQCANAQTFETLHSFTSADGANPVAALVQASDGSLYGTTRYGGGDANVLTDNGTIFRITTGGAFTPLYNFGGFADLVANLIQASDGNLYGATAYEGSYNSGMVFKITTGGALTPLYSFSGADGASPSAGLIQASDGNLYGTTASGGATGYGTVFKITTDGGLTTLHNFDGTDGTYPVAGLIQASDGNLYGTTYGTVFQITTGGAFTTLHHFNGSDGSTCVAGLIQASDGNLYGTTLFGGVNDLGTVFRITTGGTLTSLYSFKYSDSGYPADSAYPYAGLIQASDGNLYGTTAGGDYIGAGTVFQITTDGVLTTMYSFSYTDGAAPVAGLIQASDGKLYGTTSQGGAFGVGTVFSLPLGVTNHAPVANYQSVTTTEEKAVNGTLTASDVDGDVLTYAKVSDPLHGTVTVNSDGTFYYTPAPNFSGIDTFTFVANDGHTDSNIAPVNITVTPVNDPPVANPDSATTRQNKAVTINVLANDSDPDGDALTVSSVTQPSNGTVVKNLNGTLTFTPKKLFIGTTSFTYSITDAHGGSATATVTITVAKVGGR
jgi:uncharacterized repeat protein (TIGR03803 family)/VCBS repeat-containing protein